MRLALHITRAAHTLDKPTSSHSLEFRTAILESETPVLVTFTSAFNKMSIWTRGHRRCEQVPTITSYVMVMKCIMPSVVPNSFQSIS